MGNYLLSAMLCLPSRDNDDKPQILLLGGIKADDFTSKDNSVFLITPETESFEVLQITMKTLKGPCLDYFLNNQIIKEKQKDGITTYIALGKDNIFRISID
jgi:hypothetical protein